MALTHQPVDIWVVKVKHWLSITETKEVAHRWDGGVFVVGTCHPGAASAASVLPGKKSSVPPLKRADRSKESLAEFGEVLRASTCNHNISQLAPGWPCIPPAINAQSTATSHFSK